MNTWPEYSKITEAPGLEATGEQIARLYQRYAFARGFAAGGDVLEAACGSGIGLGFLARAARSVTGADIDPVNLAAARTVPAASGPAPGVRVLRMNALDLGFRDASFDLVLLLEAVYYLPDPGRFVAEARRVLRPGGRLIIGSVNKNWADFHPSPFTHRYFSVPEMTALLGRDFPEVAVYAGFKAATGGLKNRLTSRLKHFALTFDLIPGSLKMRARLKRIFIGRLAPLPAEVTEGMAPYEPPEPLPADRVCKDHKIVYYVAHAGPRSD